MGHRLTLVRRHRRAARGGGDGDPLRPPRATRPAASLPRGCRPHRRRGEAAARGPYPLGDDVGACSSWGAGGPPQRRDRHRGKGGPRRHATRDLSRLRSLPVPLPVLLALGGVVIGLIPSAGIGKRIVSPELILYGFVPVLVFEGSLGIDLRTLADVARPVATLATVGVVLTVTLVAVVGHFVLGLDWPSGLVLGAVLAGTDPIARISPLRPLPAPAPLR